MKEVLDQELGKANYKGICLTTGSAGTLGSADYLKKTYPNAKTAAGESLQCPTMLINGFGYHRIEGIGDKHIPWIHNVKQTDLVIAIDDKDCINVMRLFNTPTGHEYLKKIGVKEEIISNLHLLGISSIANLLMTIKFAKYFELTRNDLLLTVFTDSMEMYQSRIMDLNKKHGNYTETNAAVDYYRSLEGMKIDNMLELRYPEKQRIHNLKYFTWIEQQGKNVDELNQQWYDEENYWNAIYNTTQKLDQLIIHFNQQTGL
jgi:hypothetical protein